MREEREIAGVKVPQADWDATPASIQALVIVLSERLSQVEEKLTKNSRKSSKPPSMDGFDISRSKNLTYQHTIRSE